MRAAMTTASSFVRACNLFNTERTWLRTVCWLTNNCSWISSVDRPCASNSSTSRSRAVSSAFPPGAAERFFVTAASRSAGNTAAPCTVAWIVFARSDTLRSFDTKPAHPASSASLITRWLCSCPVTSSTHASGSRSAQLRGDRGAGGVGQRVVHEDGVGAVLDVGLDRFGAVRAHRTTSRSGSAPSRVLIPLATISWSSTSSTRTASPRSRFPTGAGILGACRAGVSLSSCHRFVSPTARRSSPRRPRRRGRRVSRRARASEFAGNDAPTRKSETVRPMPVDAAPGGAHEPRGRRGDDRCGGVRRSRPWRLPRRTCRRRGLPDAAWSPGWPTRGRSRRAMSTTPALASANRGTIDEARDRVQYGSSRSRTGRPRRGERGVSRPRTTPRERRCTTALVTHDHRARPGRDVRERSVDPVPGIAITSTTTATPPSSQSRSTRSMSRQTAITMMAPMSSTIASVSRNSFRPAARGRRAARARRRRTRCRSPWGCAQPSSAGAAGVEREVDERRAPPCRRSPRSRATPRRAGRAARRSPARA